MQPQEHSAVDPMPESSPFPSQLLCCACLTQCPKICPSCPNSHWEACPGWTCAAQRFLRDWAILGVIKGRWTKTMLKGKKYYQNPWTHVITWWNKKSICWIKVDINCTNLSPEDVGSGPCSSLFSFSLRLNTSLYHPISSKRLTGGRGRKNKPRSKQWLPCVVPSVQERVESVITLGRAGARWTLSTKSRAWGCDLLWHSGCDTSRPVPRYLSVPRGCIFWVGKQRCSKWIQETKS